MNKEIKLRDPSCPRQQENDNSPELINEKIAYHQKALAFWLNKSRSSINDRLNNFKVRLGDNGHKD